VFFRWNSTEMPPDAEPIVIAALDAARAQAREGCRIRSVFVTGYVDTAEIAIGAGERIATARAQGVADIFVRVGAPPNIVHARGAPGELTMMTAPDVREPRNRNAMISINFH
jgi:flagellar motor protein MotB